MVTLIALPHLPATVFVDATNSDNVTIQSCLLSTMPMAGGGQNINSFKDKIS